jgi:hypothetical protein
MKMGELIGDSTTIPGKGKQQFCKKTRFNPANVRPASTLNE